MPAVQESFDALSDHGWTGPQNRLSGLLTEISRYQGRIPGIRAYLIWSIS